MIYADNAATTKMSPVALAAMLPALEDNYGNPSSLHSVGQHAAELLQSAREAMARCRPLPVALPWAQSHVRTSSSYTASPIWARPMLLMPRI